MLLCAKCTCLRSLESYAKTLHHLPSSSARGNRCLATIRPKTRSTPISPTPMGAELKIFSREIFRRESSAVVGPSFRRRRPPLPVGSPDEADLIVELTYRVEHNGTRVWSSTNSYDGTTQVHSAQIVDPQLGLAIYDARSKTSLWSTIDHRRLAIREKNREKETIISAERLVDELKARANLAGPSVSPVAEAPAVPVVPATRLPQSPPIPIALPERTASTPPSESLGTVSVTSDPDGAEIFVDSVGHGYAPAILKLPPGKHSIQLVRQGYKDWTSNVDVRESSIVNVTARLEK
jgi:hypothetical protein